MPGGEPDGARVSVLFYGRQPGTAWWLRRLWWPRPRFWHVAIRWNGFVHNLTVQNGVEVYAADKYLIEHPPSCVITPPFNIGVESAQFQVTRFMRKRMHWKGLVLWMLGRRKATPPLTCASLVASWLNLACGHVDELVEVATPDELYTELIRRGYSVRYADPATG